MERVLEERKGVFVRKFYKLESSGRCYVVEFEKGIGISNVNFTIYEAVECFGKEGESVKVMDRWDGGLIDLKQFIPKSAILLKGTFRIVGTEEVRVYPHVDEFFLQGFLSVACLLDTFVRQECRILVSDWFAKKM